MDRPEPFGIGAFGGGGNDGDLTAAVLDRPDALNLIHALTPMGRLATTEEVANAILFLASPAAAMVTGHTLPVEGGFLAI